MIQEVPPRSVRSGCRARTLESTPIPLKAYIWPVVALLALMATIFMTVYGRQGLRDLAEQNLAKAHYLADKLPLRFHGPFFNEFVSRTGGRTAEAIQDSLLSKKIIGGLPLGRFYPELDDCVLLCATEMNRREDMDRVAEAFRA